MQVGLLSLVGPFGKTSSEILLVRRLQFVLMFPIVSHPGFF